MITTHKPAKKIEVSTLIPPLARQQLIEAGRSKDMVAINAAHRYARAMHPRLFDMDDKSFAVSKKAGLE